jgi:hypothetical protein
MDPQRRQSMNAQPVRPSQEDHEADAPLSPANTVATPPRVGRDDIYDFTVSSLEELQPALTRCIVGALLPQLKMLKDNLHQLKEMQARQTLARTTQSVVPGASQQCSEIKPSEMASAVCSALAPKLDNIERSASALPTLLATPRLPDMHSVASQLVPQIKDAMAESVENIMEKQRKAASSTTPRREPQHLMLSDDRQVHEYSVSSYPSQSQYSHGLQPGSLSKQNTKLSIPIPQPSPASTSTGQVKRYSSLLRNKQPARAFVVNFRRLVQVQKVLSLIHLIIKSTAIATLTLVSSFAWTDLLFSIGFVGLILALYSIHEIRYDRMDIEDYKSLGNLLEDDVGWRNGHVVENPNRLLKALSLSSNHKRRARALLTIMIAVLTVFVVWIQIFWSWAAPPAEDELWLGLFDEHDITVQATQLLIGTVMVGFHIVFEMLYWRETQCVMPWDSTTDMPWDPREKHGRGLHFSHRWFGLPSMWFTSRAAYDDLRLWITLSRSKNEETSYIVTKIFPEEMALYALDPDNACDLRKTLKHAKLFSLADWKFLLRDDPSASVRHLDGQMPCRPVKASEEPEELGIELALFDSATGQFLEPHPHAEYRSSFMQLLKTPKAPRRGQVVDPWESPRSSSRENTASTDDLNL